MEELSRLVPHAPLQYSGKRNKKQRLGVAAATLAWPLKAEKARRLLDEIFQYKATISRECPCDHLPVRVLSRGSRDVRAIRHDLADVSRKLTNPLDVSLSCHTHANEMQSRRTKARSLRLAPENESFSEPQHRPEPYTRDNPRLPFLEE